MRRMVVSLGATGLVALAVRLFLPPDEGPPLLIGWLKGAAEGMNGPAPNVDLQTACGSTTATYLAEVQSTPAYAATALYL
jgi:hypothetical protein